MKRTALVSALVGLVALSVVRSGAQADSAPPRPIRDIGLFDLCDIHDRACRLDEEARGIHAFHAHYGAVVDRLKSRECTLREAAVETCIAAGTHHPHLRSRLSDRFGGIPLEDAAAVMILQGLVGEGCDDDLIEELRCGMTVWASTPPETIERLTKDPDLKD